MRREIITTDDGSQSIFVPQLKEHYHSTFGAITESNHVYINTGYLQIEKEPTYVFEMGMGTGLNALLTCIKADELKRKTYYVCIEKYPLSQEEYSKLNLYSDFVFKKIHEGDWNKEIEITPYFTLLKLKEDIKEFNSNCLFDVIYYDAFAPDIQPDLWTEDIFRKIWEITNKGGILTTYCAKGYVRRHMQNAGFLVERLPGPPGKRQILRANKKR